MQIKKKQVKNALLNEGLKDFLKYGYEGASIRRISKNAGTTIGNFYNYFKNKQTLFEELVSDEYKSFKYFIEHHNEIERPDFLWETGDVSMWKKVLPQAINNFLPPLTDKFLLLVAYSKGTPYENFREELVELMKNHYIEHLVHMKDPQADDGFADLLAEQFVEGLIHILKTGKSEKHKKTLLSKYMLFVFIGVMGIIGDFEENKND